MEGGEWKLIIVLLLLLVFLIGLLLLGVLLLAYFLLKKGQNTNPFPLPHPLPPKKTAIENDCLNHPTVMATGECAMCEKKFCEKCLHSGEGHPPFCQKDLDLYHNTSWAELGEVKVTPENSRRAAHLYYLKKHFRQKKKSYPLLL